MKTLKSLLSLLFVFLIFHQTNCQDNKDESIAAISLTKMNVVYLGVENPVKIAVSGYESSELDVYIEENGTIEGSNGEYIIKPQRPGKLIVTIKEGDKIINQTELRIQTVPDLIAAINVGSTVKPKYKNGGRISKEDLLKADRIESLILNFAFDLSFKVTEFTMSKKIDGTEKEIVVKSEYFSAEQKEIMNSLTNGDEIYFKNILAMGPDGINQPLGNIKFIITKD